MNRQLIPAPTRLEANVKGYAKPVVLTAIVMCGAIFGLQYTRVIPSPNQGMTVSMPPPARPSDEEWLGLEKLATAQAAGEYATLSKDEQKKVSNDEKHRMVMKRLIRLTAEWCVKQD